MSRHFSRDSRNPQAKQRTRVIAIMVAPRDAKDLTVLEPASEKE